MIATTPCGRSHAAPKPRPRAHTNRQLAMLRATSDTHIAALANNLQDAVPVGLAILSKELLTLLLWRELGPCRRSLQWHKQANKKVSVVRGGCKPLLPPALWRAWIRLCVFGRRRPRSHRSRGSCLLVVAGWLRHGLGLLLLRRGWEGGRRPRLWRLSVAGALALCGRGRSWCCCHCVAGHTLFSVANRGGRSRCHGQALLVLGRAQQVQALEPAAQPP